MIALEQCLGSTLGLGLVAASLVAVPAKAHPLYWVLLVLQLSLFAAGLAFGVRLYRSRSGILGSLVVQVLSVPAVVLGGFRYEFSTGLIFSIFLRLSPEPMAVLPRFSLFGFHAALSWWPEPRPVQLVGADLMACVAAFILFRMWQETSSRAA